MVSERAALGHAHHARRQRGEHVDRHVAVLSGEERATLLELARGHPPPIKRVSRYEAALIEKMGAQSPAHAVVLGLKWGLFTLADVARVQAQGVPFIKGPYAEDLQILRGTGLLAVLVLLAAGHSREAIARRLGLTVHEVAREVGRARELFATGDETETVLRALVFRLISLKGVWSLADPMKSPRFCIVGPKQDEFVGAAPARVASPPSPVSPHAIAEARARIQTRIEELIRRVPIQDGVSLPPERCRERALKFLALLLSQGMDAEAKVRNTSLILKVLRGDLESFPQREALNLAAVLWRDADGGHKNQVKELKLQLAIHLVYHVFETRYLILADSAWRRGELIQGGDGGTPAEGLPALRLRRWMRERENWDPALIAYVERTIVGGSWTPPAEKLRNARCSLMDAALERLRQSSIPSRQLGRWRDFGFYLLDSAGRLAALETSPQSSPLPQEAWRLVEKAWELHRALRPKPEHYSRPEFTLRDRRILMNIIRDRSPAEIAARLGVSEASIHAQEAELIQRLSAINREDAAIAALRRGVLSQTELARALEGSVASDPNELYRIILNDNERQILLWTAQGATDAEIAAWLGITTEYLRKVWVLIRSKLVARSRPHALALARLRGVLPIENPPRASDSATTPVARMSPTQEKVLILLVRGLNWVEIGQEFGREGSTISRWMSRLLDTLGATTPAHALTIALEGGLLAWDAVLEELGKAAEEDVQTIYAKMLTTRDRDVLRSLASQEDETAAEGRLGTDEHLFNQNALALQSKLGARNRAHAVASAMHYGFTSQDLPNLWPDHDNLQPQRMIDPLDRPVLAAAALGRTNQEISNDVSSSVGGVNRIKDRILRARDRWQALSRAELFIRSLMYDLEFADEVSSALNDKIDSDVEALYRRLIDKKSRDLLVKSANGLSSSEIAAEWRESKSAVTENISNLVSRLGASTPAHAVVLAAYNGWVPLDQLDPNPEAAPSAEDLSDADRRLLHLIMLGAEEETITSELEVSWRGVKNRISRLKRKLGARTRTQLVAVAFARGLLTPEYLGLKSLAASVPDVPSTFKRLLFSTDLQILLLAALEWNLQEIAEAFGISNTMVNRKLIEIRFRLGASRNIEALLIASRHGLLSPPVMAGIAPLLESRWRFEFAA